MCSRQYEDIVTTAWVMEGGYTGNWESEREGEGGLKRRIEEMIG